MFNCGLNSTAVSQSFFDFRINKFQGFNFQTPTDKRCIFTQLHDSPNDSLKIVKHEASI